MNIDKHFNNLKEKEPYLSDLIIFNTCITDKNISKTQVGKALKRLVDKSDYEGHRRDDILEHCNSLTL